MPDNSTTSIVNDHLIRSSANFGGISLRITTRNINGVEPEVSIIMPVHNQEKLICDNLSAMARNTRLQVEMILILDACTDESLDRVQGWMTSIYSYPNVSRVIIVESTEEMYETVCDSIGFSIASANYLLEIQADMALTHAGFDAILVRCLRQYPDIFAISGRGIHPFDNVVGSTSPRLSQLRRLFFRLVSFKYAFKTHYKPSPWTFRVLGHEGRLGPLVSVPLRLDHKPMLFVGGTVMRGPLIMRASDYAAVGGLDLDHFFLGNDDHDICARALLTLGKRSAFLPISFSSPLEDGSMRKSKSAEKQALYDHLRKVFEVRFQQSSLFQSGGKSLLARREIRKC